MPPPNPPSPSAERDAGDAAALLAFVRRSGQVLHLAPGNKLLSESEPWRGAYFVDQGRLELSISSGERIKHVREASAGQLLGLASAISNSDHQCTARRSKNRGSCLFPPRKCAPQTVQMIGTEVLDLSSNAIRTLRLQPRYPKNH
jgi:hypothetical protein